MKTEDLKIREIPVDMFTPGRKHKVRFGVIHFVSCKNMEGYKNDPYNIEGIIKLFTELGAEYKFSVHDFIGREGEIINFVNIKDTAWAVGKSVAAFPDYIVGLNPYSYSVELAGMTGKPYTSKQYETLGALTTLRELQIEEQGLGLIENYIGHDWVSGEIAVKLGIREPGSKKVDPGKFDWQMFHRERMRVQLMQDVMSDCKEEFRTNLLDEMSSKIKSSMSIGECLSLGFSKLLKRGK